MTKEIYNRSIKTCEVQLIGYWAKLSHYFPVGFLLIVPVVLTLLHLRDWLQSRDSSFQEGEIWIIIIQSILSAITYWIQKRRLRFRVIKTKLNRVQLKEILIEVAEKLEWEFAFISDDMYIAKTNPGFFSLSRGEQISILFYQDSVFINSICDPDKQSSIISGGRNHENESTLIERIKEAGSI